MKLSGVYVIYRHEKLFEGCITTTVFDTNLTYQGQVPQIKTLDAYGFPYKTDTKCTVLMIPAMNMRLWTIKWV